ncbi:Hypothetical protein ADU72_0620 [Pediococcus damnosus]|uniref:Uncharacterized protein n=1 Tax=Pediococcus damnosus TaxID=51663 RepID=A0ABM6A2Y1_9LACO|nr:Hypothetical protein ADU72_0620 [Pediococcus damnosus]
MEADRILPGTLFKYLLLTCGVVLLPSRKSKSKKYGLVPENLIS